MLEFIFMIVCGVFERKRICARFFLSFVYVLQFEIQLSRGEGLYPITVTGLTPPHFCACPRPGPGFPTTYVVVFFLFSEFD